MRCGKDTEKMWEGGEESCILVVLADPQDYQQIDLSSIRLTKQAKRKT